MTETVQLIHWNPRLRRFPDPRFITPRGRRRINNFGDLLGPMIVSEMLDRAGIDTALAHRRARLLTVGSILKLAKKGDVIWGSGVNGKSLAERYSGKGLDVRAVRGPLTRDVLQRNGYQIPEVYGDPALLVGYFWNRVQLREGCQSVDVLMVPNLHDIDLYPAKPNTLDPREKVAHVLSRIAASEMVIGSSLHAIVVAEALGIPARAVVSMTEPAFKYLDYYAGTGRTGNLLASSLDDAVAAGGVEPPIWDPTPLLQSFPADLWVSNEAAPRARGRRTAHASLVSPTNESA